MDADIDVDIAWLCERIVADAGEAVLFADAEGVIRLWNDAAEAIFGYSADEAIGSSLDIIVPTDYRNAHWAGFHAAIDRGRTTGDAVVDRTIVPARHADGGRITIETSGATVVTDDGGTPIGVFNLIRDISGRDADSG